SAQVRVCAGQSHGGRMAKCGSRIKRTVTQLTRMLFSFGRDEVPGGLVLLEFDADQRLWQETVRDAVAQQCPATLVRGVAEDGVDPTPLWQTYVDAGWTELTDPEHAVELAIVLEELGRATDPTPFLATLTQFAPLAGDRFDPQQAGTAIYSGVSARR